VKKIGRMDRKRITDRKLSKVNTGSPPTQEDEEKRRIVPTGKFENQKIGTDKMTIGGGRQNPINSTTGGKKTKKRDLQRRHSHVDQPRIRAPTQDSYPRRHGPTVKRKKSGPEEEPPKV